MFCQGVKSFKDGMEGNDEKSTAKTETEKTGEGQ
jgi:hypothetical protein